MAAAIFSAAAFFLPASVSAETPTTAGSGGIVSGLQINGLKRTKPFVIERLLNRYIGRPVDGIDLNEIKTVLLKTELFDNIRVSVQDRSAPQPLIVIEVEEKWSIIALPVFGATSDGIVGGVGFIDANAFGLADKIIAAALFKPSGWEGFLRYGSEPPDDHSFGWAASTTLLKESINAVDDTDSSILEYDAFFLDSSYEIKRALGPVFSVSSSVGIREHTVGDGVPASGRVLPVSLGVAARISSWDGIFLSEKEIALQGGYSFGLIGDGFASVEGRAVVEQPLFPGLRAVVRAGAFQAADAPVVFEEGPHAAGVSILPSDFRSPSLAGVSGGFEARILSIRSGTLSALAAYQIAIAKGGGAGDVFAQGPSFGVRLYFAKIAVPAVDIGLSYNRETDIWRAAFGIGMRM
jgi:hypothetical protein